MNLTISNHISYHNHQAFLTLIMNPPFLIDHQHQPKVQTWATCWRMSWVSMWPAELALQWLSLVSSDGVLNPCNWETRRFLDEIINHYFQKPLLLSIIYHDETIHIIIMCISIIHMEIMLSYGWDNAYFQANHYVKPLLLSILFHYLSLALILPYICGSFFLQAFLRRFRLKWLGRTCDEPPSAEGAILQRMDRHWMVIGPGILLGFRIIDAPKISGFKHRSSLYLGVSWCEKNDENKTAWKAIYRHMIREQQ